MYYTGEGLPKSLVYPGLGDYTEADFTAAINELHGYAASIAQGKQNYEKTGDPRALEQVKTMVPYYQKAFSKAQEINRQLYDQDLPSGFDRFLADTLGWIADAVAVAGTTAKKIVEATGDTVQKIPKGVENILSLPVLLLIGGIAFMYLGGNKLIPRRGNTK